MSPTRARAASTRPRPRNSLLAGAVALATVAAGAVTTAADGASQAEGSTRAAVTSQRCLAPKPPSGAKTRFGISLGAKPTLTDDLRTEQGRFGHLSIVRLYDAGLPPSNAWERRKTQLKTRQMITSFRLAPAKVLAGTYDRDLRRFFRTAPTKQAIYWSYIHEPEPEIDAHRFTAAQYRKAWQHISRIAGSFCRSNLYPTLILTGWTADRHSGRSWRDYFAGSRYVSVLAWDPYNKAVGTPSSYRKPSAVYGAVVKASKASGMPWGLAETGTARTPADSSGKGRAAWIRKIGHYLKKKHPLFVSYFQSTNRGDFELRDTPSVTAYREVVHS